MDCVGPRSSCGAGRADTSRIPCSCEALWRIETRGGSEHPNRSVSGQRRLISSPAFASPSATNIGFQLFRSCLHQGA